ncbi:MAG: TraR/DksA C4-type zinc finger protein [Patescibacteria group bacterium]|nr:TraR/DksA C4-type zinc finger protein [Candidatus Beckwithbacteria bacterium]MDZ4229452.1 TraR/DksA C4-type zinc finger protein [Patescibacteria group bacterium]
MFKIKIPSKVLKPLTQQLRVEELKLKKRRQNLELEDPFNDDDRITNNAAVDTDAAEESGHDRVAALKLEVDKTLINIRKTLTRIKLGRFGLCENCGRLIDTDRLAIDPTASLCITCAAKK